MALLLVFTFAACTDEPENDLMEEDTVEMDIAPIPMDTTGMMMDTTATDTVGLQ